MQRPRHGERNGHAEIRRKVRTYWEQQVQRHGGQSEQGVQERQAGRTLVRPEPGGPGGGRQEMRT